MDNTHRTAPQQLGQGEDNAFAHLNQLHLNISRAKYPNVPECARTAPKYSDKTANGLTKCIIAFINFTGGQAERISNTGRHLDKRQQYTDVLGNVRTIGAVKWIPGTGENGTADISATIEGRSVKIEVKIGQDRQSAAQREYQERIEQAGGLYFIAKDFQSFYNWYKAKFQSNGKRQA